MILIGCLIVSVLFFITQFLVQVTNAGDDAYRVMWIFQAYWEFIYFVVVTYVAYIWIPNPDNLRYAFYDNVEIKMDENPDDANVDLDEKSSRKKKKKMITSQDIVESGSSSSKEKKSDEDKKKEEIKLEETSKD